MSKSNNLEIKNSETLSSQYIKKQNSDTSKQKLSSQLLHEQEELEDRL